MGANDVFHNVVVRLTAPLAKQLLAVVVVHRVRRPQSLNVLVAQRVPAGGGHIVGGGLGQRQARLRLGAKGQTPQVHSVMVPKSVWRPTAQSCVE